LNRSAGRQANDAAATAVTATALVQVGPRKLESRQIPLPEVLEPGAALVRVEANGLCHSDVDAYDGTDPLFVGRDPERYPRILGHEIVGIVERMGSRDTSSARSGRR
jgi:threonine dehydrogenase-like Zn-dependent dehydrogenase